jgi:nucleoside-diphosphate-sugar epimerase
MKYLILGSEGQIGKYLCKTLTNCGDEVINFDISIDANQDLRIPNNRLLHSAVKSCDKIFFLAFDCGGAKYLKENQHKKQFIDNNIRIMLNTFECISNYNKPFVFASSQMSNNFESSYGSLKLIGDHYTKSLNGIIAKFWNVYGKEDFGVHSHVITDFVKGAKEKQHIQMLTTGKEKRQFLHATDCSEALKTLIDRYDQTAGLEYHITSFEWTSIQTLAILISSIIPCKITNCDFYDELQSNYLFEPKKDILSFWKPRISLLDGLKEMCE